MQNKKKKAIATGTVVALLGAGTAYAYWTTSGEGEGDASTRAGNPDALTITQVSEPTAMYPGDSAQGINFTVKNEGNESYQVSGVEGWLTVATAADETGDCDASDYKLNGVPGADADNKEDLTFVAKELVAGGTQGGSTTIQFNNKSDANQDACKGAAVTIHYLAS